MWRQLLHITFILFITVSTQSQPVLNSRFQVEGIELFKDFKRSDLYYYAPPPLKIGEESNGRPKFKLVQMRYTGTQANADQGQSRYINLVQLTVTIPSITNRLLREVRSHMQGSVKFRPVPLKMVGGYLITAVGNEYRRLGEEGAFETSSKASGLWSERTFTLRMNNHDAQILWEQVNEGKLAISFNYVYYADFISAQPADYTVRGDSLETAVFEDLADDLIKSDTILTVNVVRADAFPLMVDISRFPEAVQKIDVNESISVAYPLLEVRCYDFTLDLRPDLGAKFVEIEASSVNDQQMQLPRISFFRNRPDEYVKQVRFDRAVKLNSPLRYRIVELFMNGDEQTSDWKTKMDWIGQIDITTQEVKNPVNRLMIDIETDVDKFNQFEVSQVEVLVKYTFKQKTRLISCFFNLEESISFKTITLVNDKDTPVFYKTIWWKNEKNENEFKQLMGDHYIFINIAKI